MVAKRYRAGMAFVEVVPVFRNNQKEIAKQVRDQLAKKGLYEPVEREIRESIRKGMEGVEPELRDAFSKISKDAYKPVIDQAAKSGKATAKSFNDAHRKESTGYWGEYLKKAAAETRKAAGSVLGRDRGPLAPMVKSINADLDTLDKALTSAGERDTRTIKRTYNRLQREIKALQSMDARGFGEHQKKELGLALEALEQYNERVMEMLTPDEWKARLDERARIEAEALEAEKARLKERARVEAEAVKAEKDRLKEISRAHAEAIKEDRERDRKIEASAAEHARKMANIETAERKRRAAAIAHDEALRLREGERLHRASYSTKREEFRGFSYMEDQAANARQRRLINAQERALARARNQVQGLMADLARLNSSRTDIRFDTRAAESQFEELNRKLAVFRSEDWKTDLQVDTRQAEVELMELKAALESFNDYEFDIDLQDEDARAALQALKADMASIRDLDIDVKLDRRSLARARQQMKTLALEMDRDVRQRVRVDTKGAQADIIALRAALAQLQDKTIGVDISEREAMAQIHAVEQALKRLQDKEVDIRVDYETGLLDKFNKDMRIATWNIQRLGRAIDRAKVTLEETTQAFRVFSPVMTAVAFAGAPVVSMLGGVVAGLGGITSMLPGVVAGFSPLIFAFGGLEDAIKKYDKAQEALTAAKSGKELTDAQKEAIAVWEAEKEAVGEATVAWIEYTDELKTRFQDIQRYAREGLFPGLQDSISTIMDRYAQPFSDWLFVTGQRLGIISQRWANLLASEPAAEWFGRVGADSAKYTGDFAQAIENTARGLAGLVDAFRPFAYEISDWLVDWTGRFDEWANSLSSNPVFDQFMDSIKATGPLIRAFFSEVGELFVKLTIAVTPFTVAILEATNGALEFINALDPKVLGAILGGIGGLLAGLMVLSGVMASLGAVSAILSAATSTLFSKIAISMAGFLAVNATAMGAILATGEATSIFGESAIHLASALAGVADFGRSVWGVLVDLFNALEPLFPVVADLVASVLDLTVSLGVGLLDAIGGVISVVGFLVEQFALLPDGMQKFIIVSAAMGLALKSNSENILNLAGHIGQLIERGIAFFSVGGGLQDALTGIGTKAKGAATGIGGLVTAMGGLGPMLGILAAVAAAVALVYRESERAAALSAERLSDAEARLASFGNAAVDVGSSLDKYFSSGGVLGGMVGEFNGLAEALEAIENDKWHEKLFSTGEAMSHAKDQFLQFDSALANSVSSGNFMAAVEAYGEIAAAAEKAGFDQEELNKLLPEYIDEMNRISQEVRGVKLSEDELAELRQGKIPEGLRTAMESSDEYKGHLVGVKDELSRTEQNTQDLHDATQRLSDLFMNQEEATIAWEDAQARIQEAVDSGRVGMDMHTEAGRRNREMLMRARDAAIAKADADLGAGESASKVAKQLRNDFDTIVENATALGMSADEAHNYARELFGIPPGVNTDVALKDMASEKARKIKEELDGIKDKEVTVTVTKRDPFGIWNEGKGPKGPGPWKDGYGYAQGGIVEFMADGGLRPMAPIAQMVPANTWRVVGDRGDVTEAYIPLDGSARSKKILLEALVQMPGMFMRDGGLVGFAAGAIATPAPAAGAPQEGAGDMSGVAEAFAALSAALTEGWNSLLDGLTQRANVFFEETTAAAQAWAGAETVAVEGFLAGLTQRNAAFHAQQIEAGRRYREALTIASVAYHAAEVNRVANFLDGQLIPRTLTAHGTLARAWDDHWGHTSALSADWRAREGRRFQDFLLGTMMEILRRFGAQARGEWGRIWNDLVDSAARIFSQLPAKIGGILVDISGKLNKHIVDPFNKIIDDLKIKDIEKLGKFPTQSHARGGHIALRDGGMMPGYTPGRDVHRFFSDTGGILELSGGEPVLRPEVGAVLGEDWVNTVNAAARNGGVSAVRSVLGEGRQAFRDGGVWRNLWGIVHEQFPWARLTSAYRPGSGRSHHARGNAVDLAGPRPMDSGAMMRIFNFLHDNYGNSAELIYTPARGRNILNGRYHTYNGAVQADHRDHVHWANRVRFSDVVGPPTGGAAGAGSYGMFDIVGGMKGWIENAKKDMQEGFIPDVAMGAFSNLFTQVAKQKQSAFFTDHAEIIDPGAPGAGVARWASLVRQALEHVGQPATEAMVNTVLRRMNQESGGNPRAINNWDVNARRGTPSKGLMQVIGPTFAAYRDPSLGNDIWDPFQNIVASMRYAMARYGSLPKAYNRKGGYADGTAGIDLEDLGVDALLRDGGGPLPEGYSLLLNNLGHEETVIPETTADVARLFEEVDLALSNGTGPQVVFENAQFKADPWETAEAIDRQRRLSAPPMPTLV